MKSSPVSDAITTQAAITKHYDKMVDWCHHIIQSRADALYDAKIFESTIKQQASEYSIPPEALISLLSNLLVPHIKSTAHVVKKNATSTHLPAYQSGETILSLAQKANYPPYLFCRILMEHLMPMPKKALTQALRDPLARIEDERLAKEVKEAMEADPLHGPVHDRQRHMIGIEYEVYLEEALKKLGEFVSSVWQCNLRSLSLSHTLDRYPF